MSIGSSSFVILYHRTPFDESIDSEGNRTWVDQKSPNGIIPTLRNLFRSKDDGTWIAWRRVDSVDNAEDESIEMTNPAQCEWCRVRHLDALVLSIVSRINTSPCNPSSIILVSK